ncbi:MAG: FKBP-type peptidyl-prolyl cis-trans isomerase SlyD [Pseudomonadota bacterium]
MLISQKDISMQIAMNTVVSITYELLDSNGNVLESSKDPVSYLHGGYDNIFPRVEEELHGKSIGDTVEITLEPADAFGEYDEELVQMEPISAFPSKDLKVGMQFEGEDESGEVILYTITNIDDGKVIVDGNHPWAGERVLFKATIADVRKAGEEEVAHGHVHGAGGHHH